MLSPTDIKGWIDSVPQHARKWAIPSIALGFFAGSLVPVFFPRPYENILNSKLPYVEDKLVQANANIKFLSEEKIKTASNTSAEKSALLAKYDTLNQQYVDQSQKFQDYQKAVATTIADAEASSKRAAPRARVPETLEKPESPVVFEGDIAQNEQVVMPGYNCGDKTGCWIEIYNLEKVGDPKLVAYKIQSNFLGSSIPIQDGVPISFYLVDTKYSLLLTGDGPIHMKISKAQ